MTTIEEVPTSATEDTTMECSICIETKDKDKMFTCNGCKYSSCIECYKIYLLGSTQDPHCIKCRSIIPYDIFLNKFKEKWIFAKYKEHRYDVLWDREKSLIPQTVHLIALKKQEMELCMKRNEIYKEYAKAEEEYMAKRNEISTRISKMNDEISLMREGNESKARNKFNYSYACPMELCKGFLNDKFECDICDKKICRQCYTEKGENHECIPELVETFSAIKKEAKPCPTCGEFISKISGCDQMFCIKCGTGFSWKTGCIEKGVIHNPHAHAFFENNPIQQETYQNNNAQCRAPIPSTGFFQYVRNLHSDSYNLIVSIHRSTCEYRQYYRDSFIRFLENTEDGNNDLRTRFVQNAITEKTMKQNLHRRDKKKYFKRHVGDIVLCCYDIVEILFWNFHDEIIKKDDGETPYNPKKEMYHKDNHSKNKMFRDAMYKFLNLVHELVQQTNINIRNICEKFNYHGDYLFMENMRNDRFLSLLRNGMYI